MDLGVSCRVLLFVSRAGKRSQSGVFTPQLPDVAETVLTSPYRNWMCTSIVLWDALCMDPRKCLLILEVAATEIFSQFKKLHRNEVK